MSSEVTFRQKLISKKYFLGFRLNKKRVIWSLVILLVGGPIMYNIFKPADTSGILTDTVKKQDLKQTVLATGEVVSQTDLSLSFKVSGFVASVPVKEGQKVKKGQILANLDQRDQAATYTSAKGALALAQANYQKVLDGASNEEVAVTQAAVEAAKSSLENTKTAQATAVDNAFKALLNSTISAVPNPNNSGSATLTISGSYSGIEQGLYKITIYNDAFVVTGLENANGLVKTTAVPLGQRGLYATFSGTVYNSDSWTVSLPNTLATAYVANYNAYQSALRRRAQ
jgi:multidrug efflux pump subunit AcrA (membrane-fusion protein)